MSINKIADENYNISHQLFSSYCLYLKNNNNNGHCVFTVVEWVRGDNQSAGITLQSNHIPYLLLIKTCYQVSNLNLKKKNT